MSSSAVKGVGPSNGSGKGPRVKYVKPFTRDQPPPGARPSIGNTDAEDKSSNNTSTQQRYKGRHNATCSACRDYGELTDCDTCRRAWHGRCIKGGGDPPLDIVGDPPKFWKCPSCIGKFEQVPGPMSTRTPEAPGRSPTTTSNNVPSKQAAAATTAAGTTTAAQPTPPTGRAASNRGPSASPSGHTSKRRKLDDLTSRSESEPVRPGTNLTPDGRRQIKLILNKPSGLGFSGVTTEENQMALAIAAATDERGVINPGGDISGMSGSQGNKATVLSDGTAISEKPTAVVTRKSAAGAPATRKTLPATTRRSTTAVPIPNGTTTPTSKSSPANTSKPLPPALTTVTPVPPPMTSLTAIMTSSPSTASTAVMGPTSASAAPATSPTPTLITTLQHGLAQIHDRLVESEAKAHDLEDELEKSKGELKGMKEEVDRVREENEDLKARLEGVRRAVEGP
ncbi:MAG: hypothetical protein M1813_007942 [Trichoglossum hirsutum]|jgi:hypothetical protein|nr:MAG: hypothetical protein M1813_007942 [Trichoglossum hirsutum]